MKMAVYLSAKEVWRNKGRFFLFAMVIALITTLVLFIAALSEGLAAANKQYLEKINAQLLVFQEDVDLSVSTSRIGLSKLNDIERVEGVQAAGPIGLSNGTIVFPDGREDIDVSLIGVEAGRPGAPEVLEGEPLIINRGSDVIIDKNVADQRGVKVGDQINIKTIQGSREEFYPLNVIGLTDEQQYLFLPSVFLPYRTWDQVRPQGAPSSRLVETNSNMVAVQVAPGYLEDQVANNIQSEVADVDVADIKTAYESLPGYQAQQSTLNTQSGFTLLIGVLVIGGFFQIQMLQKIPQIGVLKAIGTSNFIVASAVVFQIILVTTFGVLLGTLISLGLGAFISGTAPVIFNGSSVAIAIVTLLLIGPIGGLVSVRLAVRVEPLIALGLSN
jgi:putative ABC transport system permease protein